VRKRMMESIAVESSFEIETDFFVEKALLQEDLDHKFVFCGEEVTTQCEAVILEWDEK